MLEKIRSVTVAHLKEISVFPHVVARLCIKYASEIELITDSSDCDISGKFTHQYCGVYLVHPASVFGDHVDCIAMSSTSIPFAQLILKANQLTGAHLMVQPRCSACAPTLVVSALVASPRPDSHPGALGPFPCHERE